MSHNSDSYQLPTSTSPPTSSNQNNKWLPSSSSTIQNDFSPSQSHTSPIVNDVCAGSQNGVRNASTTINMHNIISPNGNHSNEKYAFTLEFSPPVSKTKKYFNRNSKPQLFQFNMAANNQEDLHSPFELGNRQTEKRKDVPLCDNPMLNTRQNDFLIDRMLKDESNPSYSSQQRSPNQSSYTNILTQPSPLHTPSSDHHDTDALSDAGTYIIEDDLDIARDDEPEHEPDIDQSTQENQIEQPSTSRSFKRYTKTKRTRQGTFDIHALVSSSSSTATTAQTVNRPVVDLNIPTHDITSPSSSTSSANLSSSSSLLSLPTESDNSIRKEPEGVSHYLPDNNNHTSSPGLIYARQRPTSLSQQQRSITPPQTQLKPAECFVISPTSETKTFPNTTNSRSRRKLDAQWKPKTSTVVPTKDINSEPSNRTSPSSTSPHSTRSNQNDTERYSFRLQQQSRQQESKPSSSLTQKSSLHTSEYTPSSNKTTTRPHTVQTDQTYSSSPFQRNSAIRQTMPASTQYNRAMSSSTTATTTAVADKYVNDTEEVLSSHPSLTKVYMNKSFALRRQRSHLVPSTTKPVQTQQSNLHHQQQTAQTLAKAVAARQPLKATTSIPSTALTSSTSSGQTNRAVELRRARAQAKIEELANRTRHQLQKTEHHNDIMSASWHSNASSSSRKDLSNTKSTSRPNQHASQKQDLLKTRTISTSYHRSSSASPNPLGEPTNKMATYRRPMTSSVTDESHYRRMNGSTYSEGDRCDSLRDDGQRLAIKLIQLSSGILAKLKPNNTVNDTDSNANELEQLVDQLQTINRTLSTIDASLTGLTSDETVL